MIWLKYQTLEYKIIFITIFLVISTIIILLLPISSNRKIVLLFISLALAIYYLWKFLDIEFKLKKNEKAVLSILKNPLILDNRVWLDFDKYKHLFKAFERLCKANKAKVLLLRVQLDEIEQIKHKNSEDSDDFKKAQKAIDTIELLQKKGALTIRGFGLKKIIDEENLDDTEDTKYEADTTSSLIEEGEKFDVKSMHISHYKSRLAEGIKNIIANDKLFKNIKEISLISETPEIRVRVRAYMELMPERKVKIIEAKDLEKALNAAKYVAENKPFTPEELYKKTDKFKKEQARKKKIDEIKAKWDYITKP